MSRTGEIESDTITETRHSLLDHQSICSLHNRNNDSELFLIYLYHEEIQAKFIFDGFAGRNAFLLKRPGRSFDSSR